jgi:hypothetical protein
MDEADVAAPANGKPVRATPPAPRLLPRAESRMTQCSLHLLDLCRAYPADEAAPAARTLLAPFIVRGKELRVAAEVRRAAELRHGAATHNANRSLISARRRLVTLIAERGCRQASAPGARRSPSLSAKEEPPVTHRRPKRVSPGPQPEQAAKLRIQGRGGATGRERDPRPAGTGRI